MEEGAYVPYCGAPPVPADFWRSWNWDPFVITLLIFGVAAYAWLTSNRRTSAGRQMERGRQTAFYAGWLLLGALLVTPLCNLTVALFSARIAQHMAMTLIAAPLIVMGRGDLLVSFAMRWFRSRGWLREVTWRVPAASAALLFAFVLWFWHLPGPYDATLNGHLSYWAMHVSLFASACLLWQSLLVTDGEGSLRSVVAALGTCAQMGLLGAILTLAPRPLYTSHLTTSEPWGLLALEDQQLGGLIMWVPGGLVFLVAAVGILGRALQRMEADADAR